ncbi:MAG: right-handed parallel beta-helix repeat-containing protein [Opitutaceae bacterium]|nr:right-handed parallel beta-helix repeat-containing protein [Opitutaceae bacterium]
MRVFLLSCLCVVIPAVHARELTVAPGRAGEPVLSVAVAAAQPGDTVRVTKGVYREAITLAKSITIVGEPGATLDPSERLQLPWRQVADIGAGVYRAATDRKPATLFLGGRVLAELDERRAGAAGQWFWKTLLAEGPPLSGFTYIRALWIYRSDEKAVYLRVENNADPATLPLTAVWTRGAIVTFDAATNASIRGLTLAHGFSGVSFAKGSRACTVSECTIGPWDKVGVDVGSGAAGCLVERNEIFRGAHEEWAPIEPVKPRYEVWQVHKKVGFYDRIGVSVVRAGAGNRIHANHVFETFDGINVGDSSVESLDKPLRSADDGRDTEIWDNVIERTRDSGIELGAGCINVRVHHNVLRQTHGGLRFKLPRIGPVFIYRNVLLDGAPFNIWYSMDDSPAEGYVYHNTIIGGSPALVYSSFETPHHIGAPQWHYLNNLVIGRQGFFRNWRVQAPVNFTADYNVVVGGNKPYPDDPAKDHHSRYVNDVPLADGFPPRPQLDSAAVDAGLDLSTYFHGKPLPGCEPGYFRGAAPDAGAYEVK